MHLGLQDAIVGAAAVLALAWLVRRRWRRRAVHGACDGCPATTHPATQRDFVPLAELTPPSRRPDASR